MPINVSNPNTQEFDSLVEYLVNTTGMSRKQAADYAVSLIEAPDPKEATGAFADAAAYQSQKQAGPGMALAGGALSGAQFGAGRNSLAAVQSPVPPVPAAVTPEHINDAHLAAWQRYSQLLDSAAPMNPLKGRGIR